MYTTQYVPFNGSKLTIPLSIENGPSRRYKSTLSILIEERTWSISVIDVVLFFNKIVFMNSIIE